MLFGVTNATAATVIAIVNRTRVIEIIGRTDMR
jgi:hypothetical protein